MNGIRIHKAFWPSARSEASWNCGHFRDGGEALGIRATKGCSSIRRSHFNSSNRQCKPKHFGNMDLRPTIDIVYRVNWFMLQEGKRMRLWKGGVLVFIFCPTYHSGAFYLVSTQAQQTAHETESLIQTLTFYFPFRMEFLILHFQLWNISAVRIKHTNESIWFTVVLGIFTNHILSVASVTRVNMNMNNSQSWSVGHLWCFVHNPRLKNASIGRISTSSAFVFGLFCHCAIDPAFKASRRGESRACQE